MKVRHGFVSNSSSSSYIIAYKARDKCEHCGRSDINLADMFRGHGNRYYDDTGLIAEGLQEVTDRLKDSYDDEIGWCKEEDPKDVEYIEKIFTELMSTVSKATKLSDSGYDIVWIRVSYNDSEMLTSVLDGVDHKIIRSHG